MRRLKMYAFAAALAVWPAAAAAQTAPPVTAGWQDGFVLQTPDADHRLTIGFNGQLDGRFSLDDPRPITNTFLIRKARPTFTGRVARHFDFKFMVDFGNGSTTLMDAYVDIRFSQQLRVRTGKDKTPVGYEVLMGDPHLYFPERSLASSLVPNRDVGVQALGDLAGGKVSYLAGVFNGVPDGSSSSADVDTNNGKDLAGRVVLRPFSAPALRGLGVHLGGSTGTQSGALPAFRTSVGQTYFSYAPGVTAGGARERISPAVFYYYRSLGAFAEYMRSSQDVTRAGVTADLDNHAWQGTVAFVVTGEAASDRNVRPARPFDPDAGQWGALMILARYSALTIDRDAFARGLAAATASADARQFTLAANWFPASAIKYYLTFERTTFGDTAVLDRPTEHVILFRTQISF